MNTLPSTYTRAEADELVINLLTEIETPKMQSCAIRNHLGAELVGLSIVDAVHRAQKSKVAELLATFTERMIIVV